MDQPTEKEIARRPLTIYKASAGSGKTYRLTLRYLTMMLGDKDARTGRYTLVPPTRDNHRSILAVTFTNLATDEMKSRILHELAVLSGMEPEWSGQSPYIDELTATLRCTPEQLADSAQAALKRLLFDFTYFNVSTIDTFFQNVLRSFAREADLADTYELEISRDNVLMLSIDRMLSDASHIDADESQTSHVLDWLIRYMRRQVDQGYSANIFNRNSDLYRSLNNLVQNVLNEDFEQRKEELDTYFTPTNRGDEPDARLRNFHDALANKAWWEEMKAQMRSAAKHVLDLADSYGAPLKSNPRATFERWAAEGWYLTSGKRLPAAVENVSQCIAVAWVRRNPEAAADVAAAQERLVELVTHCASKRKLADLCLAHTYLLGLLGEILRYINAYCQENNKFLLSDTNALIGKLIQDAGDAPYIYERLGTYLDHYLIDEFQDTSRMQWRNFEPLLSDSLARGCDNLIIGDEKQSIYRFRNADPELLHHHVADTLKGFCRTEGNDVADNTNWRSMGPVVRFNNSLFSAISHDTEFGRYYANVIQRVASKHADSPGYAKISFLAQPKKDKNSSAAEVDEEVEENELVKLTLDLLIADIRRQLRAGYRPCDIAVLCRVKNDGRRVIERLIADSKRYPDLAHVHVVSSDSLPIDSSAVVRHIISVLRFIVSSEYTDPERDKRKEKKSTARDVARIINNYDYFRLHNPEGDPAEALEMAIASETSPAQQVEASFKQFEYMSLSALVDRVLRDFVSDADKRRDNAFITSFCDLVADFSDTREGDIVSLLKWWDHKGHSTPVALPDDENAIKVLTIHKSKGLEYPCVHVPFAAHRPKQPDTEWLTLRPEWFKGICDTNDVPPMIPMKLTKSLEGTDLGPQYLENEAIRQLDELNIVYVALTRAVGELSVMVQPESGTPFLHPLLKDAVERIDAPFLSEVWRQHCGDTGTKVDEVMVVPECTANEASDTTSCRVEATYTVGKPTQAPARKAKPLKALDPRPGGIPVPLHSGAARPDLWQALTPELDPEALMRTNPADRGKRLHYILAQLVRATDLIPVCHRLRARRMITHSEHDEYVELLSRELADPRVKPWFSDFTRVMRERPIAFGSEDVQRPDRVVWTAEGTVDVIDFKTGGEEPEKYALQVQRYMKLLTDSGITNVRGFIWYIEHSKIVPVPPS